MYPPGQELKSKKLMKSRSRKLFHTVIAIIGLASFHRAPPRIRAAGAIASDEHNYIGYPRGAEAFEW